MTTRATASVLATLALLALCAPARARAQGGHAGATEPQQQRRQGTGKGQAAKNGQQGAEAGASGNPGGPGRQQSGGATSTPDPDQPDTLPTLPAGMTIQTIVAGDSIYHGKGHCFVCHGAEGEGEPAAGDAITVSLAYAQKDWHDLDSLITLGIPDALTRSPIRMPGRGGKSDLSDDEVRRVAAYVWAISQVRGEPWPGGHKSHAGMGEAAASTGTATRALLREPVPPPAGAKKAPPYRGGLVPDSTSRPHH
ncbi:MAG TPA: cytochrome c [Gemmatimonadaceae bacterium]|nr:cytochrome c [Gemmatimonadaceae bacterium]